MPNVPKATTFATAKDISRSRAFIAPDTDVIAVTPQIDVPAAISDDIFSEIPMLRPKYFAVTRPAPILVITAGSATESDATSRRLSFKPTSTIPARNKVVLQNFNGYE